MKRPDLDRTIARWAQAGVLFGGRPARRSVDIERLLLDTAWLAPLSARLFYAAVTWLSRYGNFVARHRLKRLAGFDLPLEHQPALGALLALAVEHGASKDLLIAAEVCGRAAVAGPLFEVHRRSRSLRELARREAYSAGLRWNLWVPDQAPRQDILRPAWWMIRRNPGFVDRVVRKGDLRCSILLVLQHDVPGGVVASEVALAERCSANRIAVRHALDDLEDEGYALRQRSARARNVRIVLDRYAVDVCGVRAQFTRAS